MADRGLTNSEFESLIQRYIKIRNSDWQSWVKKGADQTSVKTKSNPNKEVQSPQPFSFNTCNGSNFWACLEDYLKIFFSELNTAEIMFEIQELYKKHLEQISLDEANRILGQLNQKAF